ncbi:RSP_2648 family PIN domain-containing protein [Oceanibium sediminis]|uniref:RSP_2648 family PIN domain-containing protein n=1 Tax=Oceanibium sediminis TaxID=2026339 RepID=UPI000DD3C4E0|nr:PIN domain-containing protein [Oceanibium sediminis]
MRLLLDACILYPTVLREILIGTAETGAYTPLFSPRILEEWARAAARTAPESEPTARAEIALLKARWPDSLVTPDPAAEDSLSLPDPDDLHVLAAALEGRADGIVTLNLKDFPARTLSRHGLSVHSPDSLLAQVPEAVTRKVAERIRQRTESISGRDQDLRKLLKRANLPRLGKAIG